MELKQILFKKNGHSVWSTYGPVRDLNSFNKDFADWIDQYNEDPDAAPLPDGSVIAAPAVKDWEEALEVLNTVGASSLAGSFKLEDVQ